MDATLFILQLAILMMSVVIHEVAHGVVAYMQGDKTAAYAGRLTLNPLPHLDIFWSLILPALSLLIGGIFIGAAKPVPYNPYNLKNQKWGPAIVGFAGPASNLLLAVVFGMFVRFSHLLPQSPTTEAFLIGATMIMVINVWLAVLNMLPIPPLDGSKLFHAFFPRQALRFEMMLGGFGFILVFAVIYLLLPVVGYISSFITVAIVGGPIF
ncbi:MAG: site-2 protease family protein [bacterium]|nr:site-2 protease family protein [bacterium]